MQDLQSSHSKPAGGRFNGKVWDFVVLMLLGVFWGLSFSLARMSTETGLHPLAINYWTCLISAVMLILYCLIGKQPLPLQKNFILLYVICGILGSVVPGTLYFYAASHVSAGVLSITIATVPLATFVGAAIFKIE